MRLPPPRVAEVVIEAMAERYRSHLPLLPGAVEAVRLLGARFTLGLASSAPRSLIAVVLDASGLRSSFAAVRSTEEEARGKPAPDVYLTVAGCWACRRFPARRWRTPPTGCARPRRRGCAVIAVPRPEYPPAPDALAVARLVAWQPHGADRGGGYGAGVRTVTKSRVQPVRY